MISALCCVKAAGFPLSPQIKNTGGFIMSNEKKSGIQPLDLDSLEEVAGGYSKHIIKPV